MIACAMIAQSQLAPGKHDLAAEVAARALVISLEPPTARLAPQTFLHFYPVPDPVNAFN